MKDEQVLKDARLNQVVLSAHSGGYRPAACALERGGLSGRITDVFLFDAVYAQQEFFRNWLNREHGRLHAAYTAHLAREHADFERGVGQDIQKRLSFTPTTVEHDKVIQAFFESWLARLDAGWHLKESTETPK
jgi:hypothetical protein